MRIKMKGGDEYDYLSKRSRRVMIRRPGLAKKAKRSYNKRVRRECKNGLATVAE